MKLIFVAVEVARECFREMIWKKIDDFLSRYPLAPFLNNRVWWLTVVSLQVGGKARELQKVFFLVLLPSVNLLRTLFLDCLVLKIFQVGCGTFYLFLSGI